MVPPKPPSPSATSQDEKNRRLLADLFASDSESSYSSETERPLKRGRGEMRRFLWEGMGMYGVMFRILVFMF